LYYITTFKNLPNFLGCTHTGNDKTLHFCFRRTRIFLVVRTRKIVVCSYVAVKVLEIFNRQIARALEALPYFNFNPNRNYLQAD